MQEYEAPSIEVIGGLLELTQVNFHKAGVKGDTITIGSTVISVPGSHEI
jgi:hypothetical protein